MSLAIKVTYPLSITRDSDRLKASLDSGDQRNLPLVSIIICVYNAGEYFRSSLLSILNQTYGNLDILIIDDGSTDGCVDGVSDLLDEPRIRLFRQANAGKPTALNRAIDAVRGEFYAIHDADDISHPRRIQIQVQAMLDRPNVAAVYCGHEIIMNNRTMAPLSMMKSEADCRRAIDAFQQPAHDPTGLYRMSLAGSLRYDTSLLCCEGLDYILRLGEQHAMFVVGACLYGYRILPDSLTRRDPTWREQFVLDVLRRARERRGLDNVLFPPQASDKWGRSKQRTRDNNLAANFIDSVLSQCQQHRRLGAIKTGLQCLRLQPLDFHYYKALLYALLPCQATELLRRRTWQAPATAEVSISGERFPVS